MRTQPTDLAPHAMGDAELSALLTLLTAARPDWPPFVLSSVLSSHRHQVHALDLAIASLRCAADPAARSPKMIGWRGPHWHGLATHPVEQRVWSWCGVCGQREDRCAQRLGPDDHEFEPTARRTVERAR